MKYYGATLRLIGSIRGQQQRRRRRSEMTSTGECLCPHLIFQNKIQKKHVNCTVLVAAFLAFLYLSLSTMRPDFYAILANWSCFFIARFAWQLSHGGCRQRSLTIFEGMCFSRAARTACLNINQLSLTDLEEGTDWDNWAAKSGKSCISWVKLPFTVMINLLGWTDGNVYRNRDLEADNTVISSRSTITLEISAG